MRITPNCCNRYAVPPSLCPISVPALTMLEHIYEELGVIALRIHLCQHWHPAALPEPT
jgi:hypothetical protein